MTKAVSTKILEVYLLSVGALYQQLPIYGTGYSSLQQLSRCPFTELKVDKEFVHDAANNPKKFALLSTAITLCQRLQLSCVAEGVETEDDWNQLRDLGCDVAQGYYVARPMPVHSVAEWITMWQDTMVT